MSFVKRLCKLGACAGFAAAGLAVADYTFKPALEAVQPDGVALLDIAYCEGRLLAAGERGVIAYSDDAGASWSQSTVPVSQLLTSVDCAPGGYAWASGHAGVLLASTDRGASWTLQFDGNEANRQWLAHLRVELDRLEEQLDAAGDAERQDLEYAIEDAGFNIEDAEAALEAGPADPFLDVWFRDTQFGYALGAYGMLYRTENGGASWEIAVEHIDNLDRYHYYAMTQDEEGRLYLSGEAGLLYRSTDQGRHWERLDPGYDGSLFGLLTTADGAVLAFGLRGNILLSDDAGETWRSVPVADDPRQGLYGGLRLVDGTLVLVGAGGVVLHSTDNGRSFSSSALRGAATLSAVAGRGPDDLRIVGMEGVTVHGVDTDD